MKRFVRTLTLVLALVLAVSASAFAVPTTDRSGHPIAVPETVERIISMAPATAQVLEDLGLLDMLVAVDTQTPFYVEGVSELPQFDMMAPDIEAMAMLEPDVVFTSGMSYLDGNPFKQLQDMGVCVIDIPSSESIAAVKEDVLFTADCLGMREEAEVIVGEMQETIDRVAAIGATVTEKKTVLFEIACLPYIYSFGSGTFLNELIEIIGAENVLADQFSWLAVGEEDAVALNPDVILTNVNYIDDSVTEILSRPAWQEVTAVKNGAVHYIDNGRSSLPNHHIVDAMLEMALAVYPEQFAEFAEE